MTDKGGIGAQQYQIPPPKTQGAATGGQQLSATATQFVDKIDPFSKRYVFFHYFDLLDYTFCCTSLCCELRCLIFEIFKPYVSFQYELKL